MNIWGRYSRRAEQNLQSKKEQYLTDVTNILEEMEFDRDLFVSLLESYLAGLEAVRSTSGGHTNH